jgi:hypothetical protein
VSLLTIRSRPIELTRSIEVSRLFRRAESGRTALRDIREVDRGENRREGRDLTCNIGSVFRTAEE